STNAPVIRPADAREVGGSIVASSWQPRSFPSRIVPQPAPVELMPPTASGSTTVMGPELQTFTPGDLKVEMPRPERLAAMPNRTDGGDATALHAPQPAAGVPYAQAGAHGGHDPQAFHGADAPHEGNKQALPPYMIEPPDVLLIEFTRKDAARPLRGEFLVGPDGMVNLGTYGQVPAGGLTVEQVRTAIAGALERSNDKPLETTVEEGPDKGKKIKIPLRDEVLVDVVSYNSKFYYVISDGGGYGATVVRVPVNGSDTVMDGLSRVGGLGNVSSKKKIFVARANLSHPGEEQLLPVDWHGITHGQVVTNYQLVAGDRLFVGSDPRIWFYNQIDKTLNIPDRVSRSVLLGSTTVNSIRNRGATGPGGANAVPIIPIGG